MAAAAGPKSLAGSKRKQEDQTAGPRFKCSYIWSDPSSSQPIHPISPAATSTEFAQPLPSPPEHLLNDPQLQSTLAALEKYIHVDTPFNIDHLETVLSLHPNKPFVDSVIKGLRDGFWPLDIGEWEDSCKDKSENYITDPADLAELRTFRDREVAAGRWSPALPPDFQLLPGMKVSPMFVVWQEGKPRVVTDHTVSGLNAGIPPEEAHVKYDDMHPFGEALHNAWQRYPDADFVLYKSDVAKAFLNLPAHPLWQIHQVVLVDGRYHIVRCLVFGNRASPRIWCSLSGLLCWIGIHRLNIPDLHVYMDDFFGWDFAKNLVSYRGLLRPARQVQLLIFWDFISCPYDDPKQLHGRTLKIIGFWVDANKGSISLDQASIDHIVSDISLFLATPGRVPILLKWQRMAGYLNWVLNVFPWGHPALSELYRKMAGKSFRFTKIFINAMVRDDLTWLSTMLPDAIGVRFVDSTHWLDSQADMIVWTDAALWLGLSFVFAGNGYVYQLHPPPPGTIINIFFLELIAILSAIHFVASLPHPPQRLLLFTDSLDSVAAFNSLGVAQALHNAPLQGVASIILKSGMDIRVRHIEGKNNIRADLLSRLLFDEYHQKFPADRVHTFSPPRDLLPVRWRESF